MAGKRKPKIITVAATKGGTGKTTTAVTLAAAAVKDGKKALVCDLDGQGNASEWLQGDFNRPGCYEVLTGRADARNAIQATKSGIDLMCANAEIATLETRPGSGQRLNNALDTVRRKYNIVIIDTGPGLTEALNNALFAADMVLIPLLAAGSSLQAFYGIMDLISHIQQTNRGLRAAAIITNYDKRPKISRFMMDAIKQQCTEYGAEFMGTVRRSVVITESEAMQQDLFSYAPRSKPAADYETLYKQITGGKQ